MSRLVTPDQVEQLCINLLDEVHPQHLRRLEQQLGLELDTIERLATKDLLQDAETLPQTSLPAVRLALTGLADAPERVHDGPRVTLIMPWRMDLDVVARGRDFSDAMLRVRWLALTIAECLIQRLPRSSEPVETIDLTGLELETVDGSDGTLARAECTYTIRVADALTVFGGDALGPHQPGDAEPAPWPDTYTLTATVDRDRLTEET